MLIVKYALQFFIILTVISIVTLFSVGGLLNLLALIF